MLSVADIIPSGWRDLIAERGRCGIGLDVATTTKRTSNPSAIALIQEMGLDFVVRLILRFKTQDPEVTKAVIRELCDLPHGLRVRRVCADGTSERFFVANLKASLAGTVVVEPIVASEKMTFRNEEMTWKQYLGNLLVNTCEDGHLWLPNEKWLEKDLRQVQRNNGTFEADVDGEGNHADGFDGIKFGLHAVGAGKKWSGSVEASAARVGGVGAGPGPGRKIFNKLAGAVAGAVKRWF